MGSLLPELRLTSYLLERREKHTSSVVTTLSANVSNVDRTLPPRRPSPSLRNFSTPTSRERPTPSSFFTPSSSPSSPPLHQYAPLFHSLPQKSHKRVMRFSNSLLNLETSRLSAL